jgi:Tfp pilus assembly protein PilP
VIGIHRTLIPFLAAVLMVWGAGATVDAAPKTPAKTPPVQEAQVAEKGDVKSVTPSEFVYDPQGKTDPFESFIVKKSQTITQLQKSGQRDEELQKVLAQLEALKQARTELQTIPLAAVSLTSIVKADNQVAAMVKGPEGGKGYLLKKGTYIGTNGGVVQEIIDEERMTDLGKQLVRKVVIKEPYLDEQRKISYRNVELKMPGSFD